MGPSGLTCIVCQKSDEETTLHKCPICFKLVCDSCAVRSYGRAFCTKRCSDQFFHGDDDE
jgi:hypothetical protein